MLTLEIMGFIEKELPEIIKLAEGLFGWKKKSGADKKAYVAGTLKTVVDAMDVNSRGGQKNTWDRLSPLADIAIDETAAVLFPKQAGPDPHAVGGGAAA